MAASVTLQLLHMPALPSGKHVAVDPAPLRKLLLDAASPSDAHHLMALKRVDDLFRWLDLLVLKPADSLTSDERARAYDAPAGAPEGLSALPTGIPLADGRAFAQSEGWSEADCAAFGAFIDDRIRPVMLRSFAHAQQIQKELCKSPTLAGEVVHLIPRQHARRGLTIHPIRCKRLFAPI